MGDLIAKRKGITIKISGFTEGTRDANQCGKNAIQDFLPYYLNTKSTVYYRRMMQQLEFMGFTPGLTYQPMPYNFFTSITRNEASRNVAAVLEQLRRLTGKKSVVVAHSMGNLVFNLALQKMEVARRRQLIKFYVSANAPYQGSQKSAKTVVSGNDEYIFLEGHFGLGLQAQKIGISAQISLYELIQRSSWKRFSGEKWFAKVRQRIAYENSGGRIKYENSGLLFWPKLGAVCHEKQLGGVAAGCRLNFRNDEDHLFI